MAKKFNEIKKGIFMNEDIIERNDYLKYAYCEKRKWFN